MPSPHHAVRAAGCLLAAALLLVACSAAPSTVPATIPSVGVSPSQAASPQPTPTPTAAPTATRPVPSPSAVPSEEPIIVTIRVAGSQEYRVRLTEAADIAVARQLLAGDPDQLATIPNGRIVRGDPGVNTGYSWHIDPSDFEWAEITVEVCDGLPSDVSSGTLSGDRYCPWQAEVVDIEPG